ncbi:putative DEAD/DEAH box helicase [Trypanosoma vivax]|nr:putative DEAD/DEAH box helicase [Trypanosoma vivax]
MKRCLRIMWRCERRMPLRFRDVPDDFTDIRSSENRPLVFTPKRPEPLRDVSLSDIAIEESALQTMPMQELSQQPVAKLDPERMGLPPYLVEFLYRRFSHKNGAAATKTTTFGAPLPSKSESGFQGLTTVQARALQHFYARQDVALCAPTGSGKTFALCLALIARLMRDGPMKPFSALFLARNDNLCNQVAHWMREMWWYESDERLVFTATSNVPPSVVYRHLTRDVLRDRAGYVVRTVDRRPYICVATPEVFWDFFQRRKQTILRRQASMGKPRYSFSKTPVLPSIDIVIVDEVDEVLPSTVPRAPGNLLMRELYRFTKYQAPIQLVFTSATLAGSTVNHVRRFLKKNILECKTSHIFESEVQSFTRSVAATGSLSKVCVPRNIRHLFYTADTLEEQQECVAAALQETCPVSLDDDGSPCTTTTRVLVILPDSADTSLFVERVLKPSQMSHKIVVELADEFLARRDGLVQRRHCRAAPANADADAWNGPASCARHFLVSGANRVRGLDIDDLTHVIMLAAPRSSAEYAHWCGRVGRLGSGSGVAVAIMSRTAVRVVSGFCEMLNIEFKMQRRYAQVDVDIERRSHGF